MSDVLNTLDYFDLKNFVPNVKCKTIIGIGLLDKFAPPYGELVIYNTINAQKKLFIYPNLGHEVDPSLGNYKGRWLYDNLGVF